MDELAKRFAELSEKYGPKVIDATLAAARIDGYSILVSGALALLFVVMLVGVGEWFRRRVTIDKWSEDTYWVTVICWSIAGIVLIPALWSIVDPWTWAAIYSPEVWVAKKFVLK